jgi:hypothetical protein
MTIIKCIISCLNKTPTYAQFTSEESTKMREINRKFVSKMLCAHMFERKKKTKTRMYIISKYLTFFLVYNTHNVYIFLMHYYILIMYTEVFIICFICT